MATRNAVTGSKTVTTEEAVLTLQNKATYQSKTNRVRVQLDLLSVSTDGPADLRLVRNATLGGTPSYTDISTNTSVVTYDMAGTTVSGGQHVASLHLNTANSLPYHLEAMALFLAPGETLTFSASSEFPTAIKVTPSWREFF